MLWETEIHEKREVAKEKKHKNLRQRVGKTSNLFATCLHNGYKGIT
jgi:hypothetical protein